MVLVLSGIIVSGFFGALMGIIKFVADPQTELAEITGADTPETAGPAAEETGEPELP